jgi:uncharacterized protein (TIGR01777 family)
MKVVIAGGTGFLGQALARRLVDDAHDVVILTRDSTQARPDIAGRLVAWNPSVADGTWTAEIDDADAIVNLAGAGLADRRWTDDRKAELRESRVSSTRRLVTAVREATRRPAVFLQASAIGFYGTDDSGREIDESFPPGDDFLARLCVAWEAEAHPAVALGCRLVILRNGVVLAPDGGAGRKLRLPFKLFVGGPVASGRQYVSWIHRDDWVAIALWALTSSDVSGVINATSPNAATNEELSRAIARAVHRPSWLRVPGVALRAIFGEMAGPTLIHGQRVVPKRAIDLGFAFARPEIDDGVR